ncbi:MAG: class I SAM-dependent methyltransferase [Gemmatimonadota bacterium]
MLANAHGLVFSRRVRVLARHVSEMLPRNASVLDVGAGDGMIARLVLDARPDLTIRGVDVLARAESHIPVTLFDGATIPHGDGEFDAAMMVDVLHHAAQQHHLLREMRRVVKRAIVIKDHVVQGPLARPTLAFMDWVGNARYGVSLPYSYWTAAQWDQAFADLKLTVADRRTSLGLYPWPASMLFERGLHFIARLERAP